MIGVERTDFVSVPVQDMERAKRFYRDTLGMHSPDWETGFPEIESGNVALYSRNGQVWVMARDGSGQHQLTSGDWNGSPAWQPQEIHVPPHRAASRASR